MLGTLHFGSLFARAQHLAMNKCRTRYKILQAQTYAFTFRYPCVPVNTEGEIIDGAADNLAIRINNVSAWRCWTAWQLNWPWL